jgi:hypothetical protein
LPNLSRPPRPPRKSQAAFFAAVEDVLKGSAFGAHLAAKGLGDASRVSRIRNLEEHLRFDELVELLAHLGPDAGVALEWLAHLHGFTVVRLPHGHADLAAPLPLQQLRIEALSGELSRLVAEAFAPDSDGGALVSPGEAESIHRARQSLQQALADLGASTLPAAPRVSTR